MYSYASLYIIYFVQVFSNSLFSLQAFVSYLRSVFLMGNKKVFNIQKLDVEQFSR